MAEILAYVHKDGAFHRLHPVTKIIFIVAISVMCIISTSLLFLAALVVALLITAYLSNLYDEIIRQSKLIVMMSIVFIAITLITMPNGALIGYLVPQGVPFIGGSLALTWGAMEIGILLSLRFMILIYVFQLFLISTQPRDIVHTMERMRIPIDYTLMFIIALRFIPTLQIEGMRIHEAQLARGYNPGTGIMGKIRSVAPIVVPLVSNALGRATVLGLTIDIRGYRTAKRTRLREFPFRRMDYVVTSGMIAISCGFIIFTAIRTF
jgi:energy-coupling factor transport system permease protein